jgi:hypothetical protein
MKKKKIFLIHQTSIIVSKMKVHEWKSKEENVNYLSLVRSQNNVKIAALFMWQTLKNKQLWYDFNTKHHFLYERVYDHAHVV